MEEICLCHSELCEDRLDMLEHLVSFYMTKAEKSKIEAELFRTALARAGGCEMKLQKEEKRLCGRKLKEEKCNLEECICEKRRNMEEWIAAMTAWEDNLEQSTSELVVRTQQYTNNE